LVNGIMVIKKNYTKPEVFRINLDNSISLIMMSVPNPPPRTGGSKGADEEPFKSPFGDKPFS
jgi:hypothetical protein